MDKWILSRLNQLVISAWTTTWSNYRIPEAARAITDFVDDLSNWYVRRCRERFWGKGMDRDQGSRLCHPLHGAGDAVPR